MSRRSRRMLLWMSLALVAVGLLACGGIGGGLYSLYSRYACFHIYTYETTERPSLNRAIIGVCVFPERWIKNDPPDRLVGPPYNVQLRVETPASQATAAILHSVRVICEDGSQLVGTISFPRGEPKSLPQGQLILLSGQFAAGEWGRRPTLVADIEIEYPSAEENTRGEVRIPLRLEHTQTMYVP